MLVSAKLTSITFNEKYESSNLALGKNVKNDFCQNVDYSLEFGVSKREEIESKMNKYSESLNMCVTPERDTVWPLVK